MFERDLEQLLWVMPENCQNALIIEFFDSAGIYIITEPYLGGGQVLFYPSVSYRDSRLLGYEEHILLDNGERDRFLTRTEAANAAIEKANELYNQNK